MKLPTIHIKIDPELKERLRIARENDGGRPEASAVRKGLEMYCRAIDKETGLNTAALAAESMTVKRELEEE